MRPSEAPRVGDGRQFGIAFALVARRRCDWRLGFPRRYSLNNLERSRATEKQGKEASHVTKAQGLRATTKRRQPCRSATAAEGSTQVLRLPTRGRGRAAPSGNTHRQAATPMVERSACVNHLGGNCDHLIVTEGGGGHLPHCAPTKAQRLGTEPLPASANRCLACTMCYSM